MSLCKLLDSYRIFPRVFSVFYLYLMYQTWEWYTLLIIPSAEQSAFAASFVASAAAWFKFYVESGGSKPSD